MLWSKQKFGDPHNIHNWIGTTGDPNFSGQAPMQAPRSIHFWGLQKKGQLPSQAAVGELRKSIAASRGGRQRTRFRGAAQGGGLEVTGATQQWASRWAALDGYGRSEFHRWIVIDQTSGFYYQLSAGFLWLLWPTVHTSSDHQCGFGLCQCAAMFQALLLILRESKKHGWRRWHASWTVPFISKSSRWCSCSMLSFSPWLVVFWWFSPHPVASCTYFCWYQDFRIQQMCFFSSYQLSFNPQVAQKLSFLDRKWSRNDDWPWR